MGVCKKLAPEVAAGLLKPYDSWANRIANLRFVQNIPFSKHSATYKNGAAVISKLDTIKDTPTRIFWGDKDFCFTESFLKDWEKQFPDHETTRFQNGGHYIVEDEIDAIIPEMETFLNADS